QLLGADLEPAHPIAVTLAARSEVIHALPRAKRGSPRIMANETKFAIADCASRGLVGSMTFQAIRHCSLPGPVRVSDACRLGVSSPAPQLSVGRRGASKGGRTTIRMFTKLGLGPAPPRMITTTKFVQPRFSQAMAASASQSSSR